MLAHRFYITIEQDMIMKKLMSLACVAVLTTSTLSSLSFAAVQTATSTWPATFPAISASLTSDVFLTIEWGDITIGSQASGFDMGTMTVASSDTTLSWSFTGSGDAFFVDDLKGSDDGYYTTIQMADFVWPNGATIDKDLLTIKETSLDLIAGWVNALVVDGNLTATYQSFGTTPLTFISRNTATNNGVIGKYGINPDFELTIPAYTPVGDYTGILTYTLYEN